MRDPREEPAGTTGGAQRNCGAAVRGRSPRQPRGAVARGEVENAGGRRQRTIAEVAGSRRQPSGYYLVLRCYCRCCCWYSYCCCDCNRYCNCYWYCNCRCCDPEHKYDLDASGT